MKGRFVVVLSAVALVASGCARSEADGRRSGSAPPLVHVSTAACGTGWPAAGGSRVRAGSQVLALRNDGAWTADVRLVTAAPKGSATARPGRGAADAKAPGRTGTGAVVGEIEGLGSGSTRTLHVRLGAGRYRFTCRVESYPAVDGPVVTVTGKAAGDRAVAPVTDRDLYGPERAYHRAVVRRLPPLKRDVRTLRDAARRGDRAAARTAWRRAHADYQRLGGAYGAFGDLGDRIDGRAAGLPKGVHDPDFTGFHRVERGLWHGERTADVAKAADRLDDDVRTLARTFPKQRIDTLDLGLRAHEILEDTLRFTLDGKDDFGSGDGLATVAANVEGTRDALAVLRPLLRTRYPDLGRTDAALLRLEKLVRGYRHGGRARFDALSRAQHQRLNGAVGGALELLAPVAEICAPRRMS